MSGAVSGADGTPRGGGPDASRVGSEVTEVVSPTRTDPLARWASEAIGGPAGRRIAFPSHTWWTAARVLVLVAALAVALGVVQKNDCRERGWFGPDHFVHACYSDLPVTYAVAGSSVAGVMGAGDNPAGVAQPALATATLGGVAAVTGVIADVTGIETSGRLFFDVSAVLLALAAAAMALGVVGLTRRRRWDAALVAGSPVLVLTAMLSIDLVGVALGVLALWQWSRRRPATAGLLLGLGVAARWHVLVVALAVVLVSIRVARWREVGTFLAGAAVSWSLISVPFIVMLPQAWLAPIRSWWSAEAGYGSLWLTPRLLTDAEVPGTRPLTADETTLASIVAAVAVVALVGMWVVAVPRTPRLPVVVFVLLAALLLVGKAVPVQASLWLVPWAALAVPDWRRHAAWWAAEGLYFVGVWQYLVSSEDANRALPPGFYLVLSLVRLAVVAWLLGSAVRWSLRWGEDPGRDPAQPGPATGTTLDDPAAGAFEPRAAVVDDQAPLPAREPVPA